MDAIFLEVLNMSFTASVVIIAVFVVRLCLMHAPKKFSYLLWAVVLFRLLCPVSFESVFALLPINPHPIEQDIIYQLTPEIETGISSLDGIVNAVLPSAPNGLASVNPIQIWIFIARLVWCAGILVMIGYSAIAYWKLRKKLVGKYHLRDNIYLVDDLDSPFVTGLFAPKIYLPSALKEGERDYIIAHEQYHIRRKDHIVRILAFVALTIHWFNPLVWIAFIISGKDMEQSCDEAVIAQMEGDIRADYAHSLLRLATGRSLIVATPLAFGEGETKGRVKNILRYHKPAVLVGVISLIVVLCVAVVLGSNPRKADSTNEIDYPYSEPIPTGYPSGEIQRYYVMYGDETYVYEAEGFALPLPDGYEFVGEITSVDNINMPAENFTGARVEVGQAVYASDENPDCICLEYEDGYAPFHQVD